MTDEAEEYAAVTLVCDACGATWLTFGNSALCPTCLLVGRTSPAESCLSSRVPERNGG